MPKNSSKPNTKLLVRRHLPFAPKSNEVAAEDAALFRQAMTTVQPIKSRPQAVAKPKAPSTERRRETEKMEVLRQSLSPQVDLLSLEVKDNPTYLRQGHSPSILRDLRRGRWLFEDELDLHGATRAQAALWLEDFLGRCIRQNLHCVRIIHGKGLGSVEHIPIVKVVALNFLSQKEDVVAYCATRPQDGGSGALAVLLRQKIRPKRNF